MKRAILLTVVLWLANLFHSPLTWSSPGGGIPEEAVILENGSYFNGKAFQLWA